MSAPSGVWPSVALCLLLAFALRAADLPLAGESGSAPIIIPNQADPITREAAAWLGAGLKKSAGVAFRVLSEREASGGGTRIWVGRSADVNRRAGHRLDALPPDAFLICVEGESVTLAGRDPRGDRNAVVEFLRRHVGLEAYMPGSLWEVVPRRNAPSVPEGEAVVAPGIPSRAANGMNSGPCAGLNARWAGLHGFASRYDLDPAAGRLLRPERYADRPEVFALVGGRRDPPRSGSDGGWQLCMTSPVVLDEYALAASGRFAAGEAPPALPVTPNAGGGFCECPRCRALSDDTAPPQARRSRLVLHFANEVARRLARDGTTRRAVLKAEGEWADPAPGVSVEPNVVVFVEGADGLGGVAAREALRDRLRRWRAAGARHLGIHQRARGDALVAPFMPLDGLAAEIRLAREEGVEAWVSDDYPSWGLQGPRHWVVARLLWDPARDLPQLLDAFCNDLFGPAARSMNACFRLCREHAARALRPDADWPPALRAEVRALLDLADRQTFGVEPEHSRVRYFAAAFAWAERMAAWRENGLAAVRAARAGDRAGALAFLGNLGEEDQNPLVFMKLALDPLAGAHYCKSDALTPPLLDALSHAVHGRALLAEPVLSLAAKRALASPRVTGAAIEGEIERALAECLPPHPGSPARRALPELRKLARHYAFAPYAPSPVATDGHPDEAAWRAAPEEGGFLCAGGLRPARYRTALRLLRDEARLHAAFTCFQPMNAPRAAASARDGQARLDDAVELVLAPAEAASGREALRIVVTVRGVTQVEGVPDAKAGIRAAVRERADRWCVEISLPLSELGIAPGRAGGARLNALRYVRERGAAPEESAWFPVFADEKDPRPGGWVFLLSPGEAASNPPTR